MRTREICVRATLALLAAACGAGAPVQAAETTAAEGLAELPLDALLDMPVTGASRFAQRRSQASSAVTVITRDEIRGLGYRTLADALRGVRGTVVTTDRTYDYLGVRGFLAPGDFNTRVLLLVDGNRVNDALYDQAFVGSEFPLDLQLVERIEFIPGQGSALYGANALYGVINVVTREAHRRRSAEAGVALGNHHDRALHATLHLPWSGGGLQLHASRRVDDGESLYDPQRAAGGGEGWTHGTDWTRRGTVYLRADQERWTFSLLHATRDEGLPLAADVIYGDPRNRYVDTTSLANLEAVFVDREALRLTSRLYAGHYRFTGFFAVDYPPPTLNRDDAVAAWRGVETRLAWRGWTGHRLAAGFDLQHTDRLAQRNADVEPGTDVYLDDRRRARRASVYAEDQWALDDDWELHLGARADRVWWNGTPTPWTVNPRLAVVWSPGPAWVAKLVHGAAFRPSNAYEAFYAVDAPAGYRGNPALQPEKVRGSELVLEWRAPQNLRVSGSLFGTRSRRLILLGYDAVADRYQFNNGGALNSCGGELELEWARGPARWRLNYSHARTTGEEGADTPATVYPRHLLKGVALLPLAGPWTLGLEAQAVGRRGQAPGYGLLGGTLRGTPWDGGPELGLVVQNLADRRAWDPGADPVRQPVVPQPGRQLRLELRWTGGW